MRGFRRDQSVTQQRLKPGTVRRILHYARPYRYQLGLLICLTAVDAAITAAVPLLLRELIDRGIIPRAAGFVLALSAAVAGLAVLDAVLSITQRWFSARVGESLIYDLRTEVFAHVQRQPIAFFTRTQTGALVSRLNTDVIGAQQALTTTLSSVIGNGMLLMIVLAAMFWLSWVITVVALVLIPLFVAAARLVGRRLQRLTRESMQLDAAMGAAMTERFNVAGALLVKLFGEPAREVAAFGERAGRVRDIGVRQAVLASSLFLMLSLLVSLATAVIYGVGGLLVIHGAFAIGTLVALVALLSRLYGPIASLSNAQVDVMTALVSFDRVFEVLDLRPLICDAPGAIPLPGRVGTAAPNIEFDHVWFRYPSAAEVSLASLESIAVPVAERADPVRPVLRDVTFTASPGQLTALVGLSGAGKTTISALTARLYDPVAGTVRIGGTDIRHVTQQSLHQAVAIVTQDAHLFHDTIGANLLYARPEASEAELIAACQGAHIWELIAGLPDGLNTIVGDRGYRLSGGEKQRIALARLLLKAPTVVVLDEATAHLDSESEAAVQQALKVALAGRTSLVIAHRLSTIRDADQILVIDNGQIAECGTHVKLLAAGGLYSELYHTQFADEHGQPVTAPASGRPNASSSGSDTIDRFSTI
jgi:ATP-binding cassette subfamily B protein